MESLKASMERQRKKRLKTRFFLILILSVLYPGRIAWSSEVETFNNRRTYLVNNTNSWVEYTIESIDNGSKIHAGVLAPRKSRNLEGKDSYMQRGSWRSGISWVLKLDLPLGEYKICLKFPQQIQKCYTKILDKSDYADSLIPYWEIEFE
jgi:hypothetical protein